MRSRIPPATSFAEPVGQDVAGDSEASLELFEMLQAVECAAEDQEGPFLADQLDGGRKRATQRRFAELIDGAPDATSGQSGNISPSGNRKKAQSFAKEQLPSRSRFGFLSRLHNEAASPHLKDVLRQYELIEKVRSYDPDADEGLINRAYVFSMKAHGTQMRASRATPISAIRSRSPASSPT